MYWARKWVQGRHDRQGSFWPEIVLHYSKYLGEGLQGGQTAIYWNKFSWEFDQFFWQYCLPMSALCSQCGGHPDSFYHHYYMYRGGAQIQAQSSDMRRGSQIGGMQGLVVATILSEVLRWGTELCELCYPGPGTSVTNQRPVSGSRDHSQPIRGQDS